MSKKQSLTRALALSLLLTVPCYEVALAAPGQDSASKNETWDIDAAGGSPTYKTDDATDATGTEADAGGNAGNLTVQGKLAADANITGNIEITGTGGDGGKGSDNGVLIGGAEIPGADGGAGGNGGNVTAGIVAAQGTLAIQAQDINITAVGGNSKDGGSSYAGGGAVGVVGLGGAADAYGLKILSANGTVTVKDITITATGGNSGVSQAESNNDGFDGVDGVVGGQAVATGLHLTDSKQLTVESADIIVQATGGTGACGSRTGFTQVPADGGFGGVATAYGLHMANSEQLTITADNIQVLATGGKGGNGSNGGNGGIGGIATAYGVQTAKSMLTVSSSSIDAAATGGQGGNGGYGNNAGGEGGTAIAYAVQTAGGMLTIDSSSIAATATGGQGGQSGSGGSVTTGTGGNGYAYGVQAAVGIVTVASTSITATATGGQGSQGSQGSQGDSGGQGGQGGHGGDGCAYGVQAAGGILTVDSDSISATATAGQGGQGGTGGYGRTGGNGGNGGQSGNAYAYGLHSSGGSVQLTVGRIEAIASGAQGGKGGTGGQGYIGSGVGDISGDGGNGGNGSTAGDAGAAGDAYYGATQGNAGQAGQATTEFDSKIATAYGLYAEAGSVVNLSAKTVGSTITIGAKASGAHTNTAYAVYADGASVLFSDNALLNDDTTGNTDNTVATYLENATLGFAYSDAVGATNVGRTITGGTLNLQGSNTLMVNTDLANNTADKFIFDSLAADSNTGTQYITVGYDPALDPANLGYTGAVSNVEVLEITNLGVGQDLSNFQAKANVLDSALYKYTVTPDINIIDNKIEISGITTEKLATPSEGIMTAGDALTGMSNLWRIEGNNLMKRMGDLRSDPEAAKGGVWARYYRGELSAAGSYGRSLEQDYTAFQGGIDRVQAYQGGRLVTGLAVNHISSNSGYSSGSGEGSSTGLGLYTSWLGEKGHYVDVILRASRLNSNFKSFTTAGVVTGDYSTWAYGLSAEYGYRHKMQSGWFVEPQAELSLGHVNSASYTMSNGARVENGSINSVTGRLGFILGKEFKTAQRPGNVYLKGSLYHEFGGKGSINAYFGNDSINADGSPNMGTWYELGLGTNLGIAKNSNLYVDAVKTFGGKINTKWQLNAGVRVNF